MPRARNNIPAAKDKPVLATRVDSERFGDHNYAVEVYVDWVALIRTLGRRAAENKNGTASLMYGSIIVKARQR